MSQPNPYQSPAIPAEAPVSERRTPSERDLFLAALGLAIIGGIGLLICSYCTGFLVVILDDRNRMYHYPLVVNRFAIPALVLFTLGSLQSLLIVAGSVSMFRRKQRWLAIAGAQAGIFPICGLSVISLIMGNWTLNILRRPEVKALFAANQPAGNQT